MVVIDVSTLYADKAKLDELAIYERKAVESASSGKVVILTGPGPVWLYLKIAHALHGKVKKMIYRSPVTGDVIIFDHDPF
jgi:hypothetical protein